eukprot:UN02488
MAGEPYKEAVQSLCGVLERLPNSDTFNVGVFDHTVEYFKQNQVEANESNQQACKRWIDKYEPNQGGTKMKTPLLYAMKQMEDGGGLPFVVLITDGCVESEKRYNQRSLTIKR